MDKNKVVTNADGSQTAPFAFSFDAKSMAQTVTVDEATGDLYIEGYASDFDPDRQSEAFAPDSFRRGLKSYMDSNPILLYHHKNDHALGQVVEADLTPAGLHVKARVDAPAIGSWAEDVFNKIKKGTIKAFSVGGIFHRRDNVIYDVDLCEISVTPFPVNPRTTFEVVAGKAFGDIEAEAAPGSEGMREEDRAQIQYALDTLTSVFDAVGKRHGGSN